MPAIKTNLNQPCHMKTLLKINIVLVVIALAATACSKNDDPSNQPDSKETVSGTAKYANGNSLPDAKITIEHTVWEANYVIATSDGNGNYEVAVQSEPAGSWTAKAQIEKDAYGQHYVCDLEVNDTSYFYATDETVRNFTWKLTGQKITGGYYGAHVDVYHLGADVDMTQVILQLTPADPQLLDGSQAVTIERNLQDVAGTFMVNDIPIGKYNVKAIYPGKILLLSNRNTADQPGVEKEVVFGKNGVLGETEYNIEFWLSE